MIDDYEIMAGQAYWKFLRKEISLKTFLFGSGSA